MNGPKEHMMILDMIAEGKITPAEAEELFRAMAEVGSDASVSPLPAVPQIPAVPPIPPVPPAWSRAQGWGGRFRHSAGIANQPRRQGIDRGRD